MNNKIIIDLDENIIKMINDVDLKEKIEKIVFFALEEEKINVENVSICITAVSSEEIRKINKEYRNIDKSTDVLSFPIFTKEELNEISSSDKEKKIVQLELGDVILCIDVIKEHAIEYETGIYRETLYMITHSVFHLLGYDHENENEKVIMRQKEEKILEKLGEM